MKRGNGRVAGMVGRATDGLYPLTDRYRARQAQELAPFIEEIERSLRRADACSRRGDPGAYMFLVQVKEASERAIDLFLAARSAA